jgi:hypothetical protein
MVIALFAQYNDMVILKEGGKDIHPRYTRCKCPAGLRFPGSESMQ